MRRRLIYVLAAVLALLAMSVSPADAKAKGAEKQPVVQEWEFATGDPIADGDSIGWTNLLRKSDRISGTTHVSGLITGGVYTFWIIAISPNFTGGNLDEIFVARGGSAIVGHNGKATVHWSATEGQSSIDTSAVSGPAFDDALDNIDERIVRIEIAYHGQEDNGYEASWEENFWDGDFENVCADPPFVSPPGNDLPPGQQGEDFPHCPVNYASTHAP